MSWKSMITTTVLFVLLPLVVSAQESSMDKPEGLLICEGVLNKDDQDLKFHTVVIDLSDLKRIAFDGFDYGSGGLVYNNLSIVLHAPKECLKPAGDALAYSNCLFTGVIDRVDGSFAFYHGEGAMDGNVEELFFWSQEKGCRRGETKF